MKRKISIIKDMPNVETILGHDYYKKIVKTIEEILDRKDKDLITGGDIKVGDRVEIQEGISLIVTNTYFDTKTVVFDIVLNLGYFGITWRLNKDD